jgi:hypothetical protein
LVVLHLYGLKKNTATSVISVLSTSTSIYPPNKIIKMAKQNPIHVPLRSKLSKKRHKSPNGYILFCKIYMKSLLDSEFTKLRQQDRIKKAAQIWTSSPDDLKNSFIVLANRERILKSDSSSLTKQVLANNLLPDIYNHCFKPDIKFIFDDHCCLSEEIPSKTSDYENIFDEFINADAYV